MKRHAVALVCRMSGAVVSADRPTAARVATKTALRRPSERVFTIDGVDVHCGEIEPERPDAADRL